MGMINVSKELHYAPIWPITVDWLERECNATLEVYKKLPTSTIYYIEGEDIPEGHTEFWVEVRVIVPGVIGIVIIT